MLMSNALKKWSSTLFFAPRFFVEAAALPPRPRPRVPDGAEPRPRTPPTREFRVVSTSSSLFELLAASASSSANSADFFISDEVGA